MWIKIGNFLHNDILWDQNRSYGLIFLKINVFEVMVPCSMDTGKVLQSFS